VLAFLVIFQNSDGMSVVRSFSLTVRPAKNIANKNTHSSNREKGEIEKNEPHKHTVANSSTTFRDETDAVQVPLEKGKAAKRQIRTIADRRRGAVFVVAKKYTTVHSRTIQ